MSASLVGSEMCIRDSRCRALALPPCSSGTAVLGAQEPLPRCGGRASMPVSYTHLTLPTICSV
eukprot:10740198-Alexandrium_andersonii.AAC.1